MAFVRAFFFAACFLSGNLFSQVFFNGRSEGLKYVYHAFSDDSLGFAFNPALTAKAEVFDTSFSFTQRPFLNQSETLAGLLPLGRWVLNGGINLLHPNIGDAGNINAVFEDGRFRYYINYSDINLAFGLARPIVRGLYAGASLEIIGNFFLNQFYFASVLHAGGLWEQRITRFVLFRAGLSLEKPLLGSLTGDRIFQGGFSSQAAISAYLPSLLSEAAVSLNVNWNDPYALGDNTNKIKIESFGIGVEALKNFYLTPRVSIRIPTEDRPFALSMGMTIQIPTRVARFEVTYALNREFGIDSVGSDWRHTVSVGIRGELARFFPVRAEAVPFPDSTIRFGELQAEPAPPKNRKPETIDSTVKLLLNLPAPSGSGSDESLLEKALGHYLSTRLRQTTGLKLDERGGDLSLTPRLEIAGESMRLSLSALDASRNAIFSRDYHGDYLPPLEHQDQVDQLRSVVRGSESRLIPFTEPFHLKKNRETLYDLLSQGQKDFETFVTNDYLKTVRLSANLAGPELFINGTYLGLLSQGGMALTLKPGSYNVLAQRKGYESVNQNLYVNARLSNELRFNTNIYSVNIFPILIMDKPGVSISLGRESKTVRKDGSNFFEDVKSTNRSLAVNGFYQIRQIPLLIQNGFDRRLLLMPDYSTRFQNESPWKKIKASERTRIEFTGSGLRVRPRGFRSENSPEGVQLPPFFARDYEINIDAVHEGEGEAFLTLIGEKEKKIILFLKNRKVWVQSDFDDATSTGKLTAQRLKEEETSFAFSKRGNTLKIFAGERKIYNGPAPEEGFVRVFLGATGGQTAEESVLSVNEFSLKHY